MTRPIIWATGTFLALALSASFAGQHIAARVEPGAGAAAPAPAPATPPRGPAAPDYDRIVTIDGDRAGHHSVRSLVDGRAVTMLVDTGASVVALRSEDAEAAGYRPLPRDFTGRTATANGAVEVAPVRLREMRVGDIVLRDVDAVVLPPGKLGVSLLGMSFLRRLKSFDIARGRLTLRG